MGNLIVAILAGFVAGVVMLLILFTVYLGDRDLGSSDKNKPIIAGFFRWMKSGGFRR